MPEATLNEVSILGRLTRDPEIRNAGSSQVASFAVATTDTWRNDAGTQQSKPQFHPVVIWNQALIEAVVPHMKKGARVLVKGSLEHRDYETNGVKRTATEIVLRTFNGEIKLLDRAPVREEPAPATSRTAARNKPGMR